MRGETPDVYSGYTENWWYDNWQGQIEILLQKPHSG